MIRRIRARTFAAAGLAALLAGPALAQAPTPAEAPAAAPAAAADPFGGAAFSIDDFRAAGGGFDGAKIAAWNATHSDAERVNIRNGCTLVRGAAGTGRYGDDLLQFCNAYVGQFWRVFIVAAYAATAIVVAGFLFVTFASARRVRQRLAELEARGVRRRSGASATGASS